MAHSNTPDAHFYYRHITLTDVSNKNVYLNISRETSAARRRDWAFLFFQIFRRSMAHQQKQYDPSWINILTLYGIENHLLIEFQMSST